MSRRLDDLDPRFQPLAMEYLARTVELHIPVLIVDTLRTPAEHAANLAAGTSWTPHSKHLDGLAMDIVPYLQFRLHGPNKLQWDATDPTWERLAELAERLGLRSGYRWRQRDCGHIEYAGPVDRAVDPADARTARTARTEGT